MLKYNTIERQGQGRYQSFLITLKDNVVTFHDYGGYEDRNKSTIKLITQGLKSNEEVFLNKNFQITINTSDQRDDNALSYAHDTDKYKTIPCFSFDGWRQIGIDDYQDTVDLIKKRSIQPSSSDKLFWAGSIGSHIPPRVQYQNLASAYPNLLICNAIDFIRKNPQRLEATNFTTLPDHCQYKYLLDIEGVGWSARLKYLCFTNRVLFINDRPYKEFWMDGLVDGENCIVVKRDLSDLIEKLSIVSKDEALCARLANNLNTFANNTLTMENINRHTVSVFAKLI